MQQYKYFAFISYNSKDTKWGKKVQRKLEGYRMPATLCSEHGWKRRPINPVFFAPTDIQPGGLSSELQERLKASRNLIVICSPNSAKSQWVGKEIEFFHSLGRTKNIHFFIVDGIPHSGDPDTECFNPVVDKLGLPEILGANIHERNYRWPWLNKERAYVQLITKLLGVEFDSIWQRHKRLLIQKAIAWAVGIVIVVAALIGVWANNQPVDISVSLNELSYHNSNLPPLKDAVVTMSLGDETKTDTLADIGQRATFVNIPHKYLNHDVNIKVACSDWLSVDTTVKVSQDITINISRDPDVYGKVHFRLWNINTERPVPDADVSIDGTETKSDANGIVDVFIPLKKQKTDYEVSGSLELEDNIIHMPSGKDDALIVK